MEQKFQRRRKGKQAQRGLLCLISTRSRNARNGWWAWRLCIRGLVHRTSGSRSVCSCWCNAHQKRVGLPAEMSGWICVKWVSNVSDELTAQLLGESWPCNYPNKRYVKHIPCTLGTYRKESSFLQESTGHVFQSLRTLQQKWNKGHNLRL